MPASFILRKFQRERLVIQIILLKFFLINLLLILERKIVRLAQLFAVLFYIRYFISVVCVTKALHGFWKFSIIMAGALQAVGMHGIFFWTRRALF